MKFSWNLTLAMDTKFHYDTSYDYAELRSTMSQLTSQQNPCQPLPFSNEVSLTVEERLGGMSY